MTHVIASIAGPYLLLTGIGFWVSRGFYRRMISGQTAADPILLNLSGAAHFIVGMIILVNHSMWSTSAEIAVSLLGIAAALKGAMLIVIPDRTKESPHMSDRSLLISGAAFAIIGGYFIFIGYL